VKDTRSHVARRTVLGFLAVGTPVLASCGMSSSSNPSGEESSSAGGEAVTALNVPLSAPLALVNPIKDTAAGGYVYSALFESLIFTQDPDGLKPAIATEWVQAEDGLSWTFTLDPTRTFHDGTPVTADDVVFTIMAEKDPTSPHAGTLGNVSAVEAVDPQTVKFTLTTPNSAIYAILGAKYILPRTYYESVGPEGFSAAPIGCGPFAWAEAIAGGGAHLSRYDGYTGFEQPLQDLFFTPVTSAQSQVAGLESGDLDVVPDLATSQIDRISQTDGLEVAEVEGAPVSFIAFNALSAPMNELAFRQAVSYAVDRQALVDVVMGGHALVATGLITPPVIGFDDTRPEPEYDVERATELIAQTSYDGTPLRLTYPTSVLVNADQVAQSVASYLDKIGIATELVAIDYTTFLQQWAAKSFQGLYIMQYKNGTDADTIISSLYARGTRVLFDDAELFDLVDASRRATGEDRLGVLADLEERTIGEQQWYAPLMFPNAVAGVRTGVPYEPNPFNPTFVAYE